MPARFTVRTDVPAALKAHGFVAWIHDAKHPDDPDEGASISWHQDAMDANRVCCALNYLSRQKAASARYHGVFDDPDLVMFGPLTTDRMADMKSIRRGDRT